MRSAYPLLWVVLVSSFVLPGAAWAQTNFTGPRVEVRTGWDQVKFDLRDVGQTGRGSVDGLAYGVSAGYDVERPGGLILGGEVSLDFTSADLASFKPRRDISILGRVGTRISENSMLYAKIGYTNLRARTVTTIGDATGERNSRTLDGIRLGAGAEVGLLQNLYLKAEYDYSNYEDGVTRNQILTGVGFRF